MKLTENTVFRNGYGLVPREVLWDRNISSNAKTLYCLLAVMAGDSCTCYPTQKHIRALLGFCEKTIRKCTYELKERGYITTEKETCSKGIAGTLYHLVGNPGRYRSIHTGYEPPSSCTYGKNTQSTCTVGTRTCVPDNNNNNINNNNKNNNNNNNNTYKAVGDGVDVGDRLMRYKDPLVRRRFEEFLQMRKDMGFPVSSYKALDMLMRKLNQLAKTDTDKQRIIEQSLNRGWKSFFPIYEMTEQSIKQEDNRSFKDKLKQRIEEMKESNENKE